IGPAVPPWVPSWRVCQGYWNDPTVSTRSGRIQGDKVRRSHCILACLDLLLVVAVTSTLSPCHLVTLSPCHLVTLSPCHLVTLSPCLLFQLPPRPARRRVRQ